MAFGRRGRREGRLASILLVRIFVSAQQAKGGRSDVFGGKTKILQDFFTRSGRPVMIDRDASAFGRPTMPSERTTSLNGNALLQRCGQNAFAVSVNLGLEQTPARHTYDPRPHTKLAQPRLRFRAQ